MVLFEIEEDEIFAAQANTIDPGRRELDKKLEDIIFIIARIPHEFENIPNTEIRRVVYDGTPRLRVWFTVESSTKILLRSIERYESNEI